MLSAQYPSPHTAPLATLGQAASDPPWILLDLHPDHLGSVRIVTDDHGAIASRHAYLPFGEDLHALADVNTHRFTGHERDAETGLDYTGSRGYASFLCRFLTMDVINKSPRKNPVAWNGYAYVMNAPIRLLDPDGRCAAPALEPGQIGFCVDTFIRSASIPNVFMGSFAQGDNRSFEANGMGSFRTRAMYVIDLETGHVTGSITPGTSYFMGVGRIGSAKHTFPIYGQSRKDGSMSIPVEGKGLNGWSAIAPPGSILKEAIDYKFELLVTRDGKPSLGRWEIDAYPSYEVWGYFESESGSVIATPLFQFGEDKIDRLAPPLDLSGTGPMAGDFRTGISSILPGQTLTIYIGSWRKE